MPTAHWRRKKGLRYSPVISSRTAFTTEPGGVTPSGVSRTTCAVIAAISARAWATETPWRNRPMITIDRVTRSMRCPSNETGKKRSGCLVMPLFGMRYAGGRTPTIRTLRPSSCTDAPTRDSEPPNVERQSA